MRLRCADCGGIVTYKFNPYRWITLKCKCKVRIIYPRGVYSVIGEREYNPNHNGVKKDV